MSESGKQKTNLTRANISITISIAALTLSAMGIYFQYFYLTHDFTLTPLKGTIDKDYITVDIAMLNRGDFAETVMDVMSYCHEARESRVAYICSDESLAENAISFQPIIVKPGQTYLHRERLSYSLNWLRSRRQSEGDTMFVSIAVDSLGTRGEILTTMAPIMHFRYVDDEIYRYKISTFVRDLLKTQIGLNQVVDRSTKISGVDDALLLEAHDKFMRERAEDDF